MKKHLLVFLIFLFAAHVGLAQRDEGVKPKGLVNENPTPLPAKLYRTERTILEAPARNLATWKARNWTVAGDALTTGEYKANQVSSLESPVILLPLLTNERGRINVYVEESFELESYYDKGIVQVSDDNGATWKVLSARDGRSDWRTSLVNLTEYAGKAIKLSLRLTSDAQNHYKGWSVRNVTVKQEVLPDPFSSSVGAYAAKNGRTAGNGDVTPLGVGNLTGAVTAVDAARFPTFIFAQVNVEDAGVPLLTLDETNFFLREYVINELGGVDTLPVPKDEAFLVYKPLNNNDTKYVDIVFLMDNSGSMSDEQQQVSANVTDFVNQLALTSFDYQLGLCRFGQGANSGIPLFQNNAGFYTNTTDFINMWNSVNTVDGGNEPSWDALFQSSTQFSFRAAAQRIFILITDESITGVNTGNNLPISQIKDRQVVIDQLKSAGVKTYTLVSPGIDFENDFGAIATATEGRSYNITSPFNDILVDIANEIKGTYTIRYAPTNTAFDGRQRIVEVNAHYGGNILRVKGSYTPGTAPVILRTDQTLALHNSAQLNNTPLTIQVETLDWNPQYLTDRVTLYYRRAVPSTTTPQPQYSQIVMTKGTPVPGNPTKTLWQATIPAANVLDPGVQYYIRATNKDGTTGKDYATTTAPEFIDRPGYPFSIAVLPNLPPSVSHTPITTADPKATITFSVYATDNTTSISSVKLNVSKDNGVSWSEYDMTPTTTANTYEYVHPAIGGTGSVVQYYIIVTDNFNVHTDLASRTYPYSIAVGVPWAVTPTASIHTIRFFKPGLPNPASPVSFEGSPLVDGDVIAAMYDPGNGVLKPAGKLTWNTTSSLNSMPVYGDNPGGTKDGYTAGDPLAFRIYRKQTGEIQDADYIAYPYPPATAVTFGSGKITPIKELTSIAEHAVVLEAGYSLWSTYLTPRSTSFADILQPIASLTPTVADASGTNYYTVGSGGPLTNYAPGYGYAAILNSSTILRIKGTPSAANRTVILNDQGVLVGTQYRSPQNVERVFPASPDIYMVERYLKDAEGNTNIENYSPALGFNEWTNKNMEPGKAYKVTTDFGINNYSFVFPTFTGAYPNRVASGKQADVPQLPQTVTSIERYMSVLIPAEAQKELLPGAEIRAYNATAKIVGRALAREQGMSMVLDGTLIADQEPFTLRIVNKTTNEEKALSVTTWKTGNGTYQNHRPAVVGAARQIALSEDGVGLNVFPNPLNSESTLIFKNSTDQDVKIEIYDTQGSKVMQTIANQHFTKGTHAVTIQRQSLPPGLYVVKKTSRNSFETTRIMIK